MDRIVADASVIVKLFVREEYTEHAIELRDRCISEEIELVEPNLLIYEVLNAIRYNKAKKFNLEELKMVVNSLYGYEFNITELDHDMAMRTIDISIKYGTTIYDSVYVALAQTKHAELYTADGDLINGTKLPFIKHIKDFK